MLCVLCRVLRIECELLLALLVMRFKIGTQPLVGKIERMGICPILVNEVMQAIQNMIIADFDGQLTPAIKAAWGEID